ncbi:MAG: hypothetical protein KDK39_19915, partial [Leptospiraceae bacterium]|nr:hypothetical protein [Leptospiraceae bacterium]
AQLTLELWNVSQVRRPLHVFVPQGKAQIRPYANEGNSIRLKDALVHQSSTLPVKIPSGSELDGAAAIDWSRIECQKPAHFKFGLLVSQGLLLSTHPGPDLDRPVCWLRRFPATQGPLQHNAQIEIYNSKEMDYAELEVHAPSSELALGQKTSFHQDWLFWQNL